jgi:hypothetical protein
VVAQSCRSIVAAQIAQPIERNLFVQLGFSAAQSSQIVAYNVKRIQSAFSIQSAHLPLKMVADVVTIPGRSNGPSIFPEGGCG